MPFSLFHERTGLLLVLASSDRSAERVRSNVRSLARLNYSNPLDHGAAIVRTILQDPSLTATWRADLETMRQRIAQVRRQLASANVVDSGLTFIGRGKGLFALLPLTAPEVQILRRDHGVYRARTGRINLAGLNDSTIQPFVAALHRIKQPRRREPLWA